MTRVLSAGLLLTAALVAAPAAEVPPGFVPLFNGADLTGWRTDGIVSEWGVKDGVLVCKGGKGGRWLLTERQYADFELRFEYRWGKMGANSGVALRAPRGGSPAYDGMEIQLTDDLNYQAVHKEKLLPVQRTGSLYRVAPAKAFTGKPVGEWNAMHITCQGRGVRVVHNGREVLSVDLERLADDPQVRKEHPGLTRTRGHVGFQSYVDRVEFRNVWIKELK